MLETKTLAGIETAFGCQSNEFIARTASCLPMPFQQLYTGAGSFRFIARLDSEDPKYGHVYVVYGRRSESRRAKVS